MKTDTRQTLFFVAAMLVLCSRHCLGETIPPDTTNHYNSAVELHSAIRAFLNDSSVYSSATIGTNGSNCVTLVRGNTNTSVMITFFRAGTVTSPGVVGVYAPNAPTNVLPTEQFVSPAKQHALFSWLQKEGIEYKIGYYLYRGTQQSTGRQWLEAYTQYCSAKIRGRPETVIELLKYLEEEMIFLSPEGPFIALIRKR